MKIRFLIAFIFLWSTGYSQPNPTQPEPSKLIQSPNAASLGIYGKIDISSFTGLANISIPIFSLKEGDIDVNCQLQYFSGGVKPEQHPGWVGQNWSLNVGGQVTRKINGEVDEVAIKELNEDDLAAYYYKYGYLNDNSWFTDAFMEDAINPSSGHLKYLTRLEPDEFMFTLPNGISGSFFLDHTGAWKVKSKTTTALKVSVAVNPQPFILTNANDPQKSISIKRLIYVITITDPNGYKYTFGNNTSAIEFGRSFGASLVYNQNVIAQAWYLTKIESPTGNLVNFEYVRKENQYHLNRAYPSRISGYSNCQGAGNINQYSSLPDSYYEFIVNPCLLSKITASSFNVFFDISTTIELKYPFIIAGSKFNDFKQGDLDVESIPHGNSPAYIDGLTKYYKLDKIRIFDNNNISNGIYKFTYSGSTTKRLFLYNLTHSKTALNTDDPEHKVYQFSYDNTELPPYNSLKTDKWGYYNNKPFPLNPPPANEAQAMPNFEMDEQYAKAGILTQIKYPTGGYTNFTYEPNSYSDILQKINNSIVLLNQSGIGGGLRIRQITNFDNLGNQSWKKYSYASSANPAVSSGILAGISRIYVTEQTGSSSFHIYGIIDNFNYNDKRALNYTDGKEVVYSEVKEELQDGSYTISKYSNSDNILYRDKVPLNTHSWVHFYDGIGSVTTPSSGHNPYMSHISMDLERGNLLSQEIRNSTGLLVKKVENIYNTNPARFNQFVRSICYYNYGVFCNTYGGYALEMYLQALTIFNYLPYIEKQTEFNYAPNGLDFLKTETDFTYDPQNFQLIKKTVKASNNDVLESVYKYPPDFSSVSPYNEMVNRNIISPVIEKIENRITQNVSKEMARAKTNYSYFSNNIVPFTFQRSVAGNTLETEYSYNVYDDKGNIRQITGKDGVVTTYIWGYNSQYIVAKIVNKTYDEIINQSGINLTAINNPATIDSDMRLELNKLRQLTNGYATTYTYKLLVGISSETDPNGRTTYYEYDWLNRLELIRDKDNNILKKICYNYYGQIEDCTTVCPPNPQPNWQNTNAQLRCQLGGNCVNTGYQEQEQVDINPCTNTIPPNNVPRWVVVGYNPTECPSACINLTSTNIGACTNYIALYSNATGSYPFAISTASGLQPLGAIPAGTYTLHIYRASGIPLYCTFKSGCRFQVITGTSAMFYDVQVSAITCNSIYISNLFD